MSKVKMVDQLLGEYRSTSQVKNPVRIKFFGIDGYDVYNPSSPFEYEGETYLIGRVEKRDSENSKALFFKRLKDDQYILSEQFGEYTLQDPYISRVTGTFVFGGTEIFPHPSNNGNLWWRAKFFSGEKVEKLNPLCVGPNGMKDIRVVELNDGRVGVFSRPQGDVGGRGKIGFMIIDSLDQLDAKTIEMAPLLNQFDDQEWGGVNQAYLLKNGWIGVLGHIAKFSEGDVRHYYPMVFELNPLTMEYTEIKIIAERKDFLSGPSKRDDLVDVLFSSGIEMTSTVTRLYTGVSDAEVQMIEIPYPFSSELSD